MGPREFVIAVGEAIKTLREQRDLTQMGVGNDCETHYNYIGEIERGIREPTVFKIADIAIGLGVKPSEIFVLADQLLAEEGRLAEPADVPGDDDA